MYASKDFFTATTVLGSCISTCVWDKKLRYGGINHYLLPYWNGEGLSTPKYGNIAIEKLIEKMLILGSSKKNLVAKIFGGMDQYSPSVYSVGSRNSQLAVELLIEKNIHIAATDTGGRHGRKITFNSETGRVNVRYVNFTSSIFLASDRFVNV